MSERVSPFGDTDDFDVSGFAPKKVAATKPAASADVVRAVSEASSFRSRDPAPIVSQPVETPPARNEIRRYRTGRDIQLNCKVNAATRESFYEVSDAQGWVLGETLERAIAALKRELSSKNEESGQ